jgi:hypothetical protein
MRDARVVLVIPQANLSRRLLGVSHMVAETQTTYYLFQFQASSMAESNLEVDTPCKQQACGFFFKVYMKRHFFILN